MTARENKPQDEKAIRTLEEICDNTRAIRRVVNRILDHLHESQEQDDGEDYESYPGDWQDLDESDDMYY
jgi:hypothetical protein